MKVPFFTVLINTYNYGKYVEEAVSSVIAQDFPAEEREILVVDDGSTDDTEVRLRKFGEAIRYFKKPNGGQASAFNFGFARARGNVIALLDADDLWLPAKLGRVYEEFQRHPDAGMVYHRVHLWDGAADISEDPYFIAVSGRVTENRRLLLQYPMVGTSCLAFRREALKQLLPVPEALRLQADAYLTALVIFVAPVAAVTEFLAKYRVHGENLFQINVGTGSVAKIESRISMREVLLGAIPDWLQRNGENTSSSQIRGYLKQWQMAQESDGFVLKTPGNWKYFLHRLTLARAYGEIMTRSHRVYSYVQAFSALFLGYDHLHLVDDVRMKYKRLVAPSGDNNKAKDNALAAKG